MKVVHIVTYDSGGAYNAARRIVNALKKRGIDGCLVVFSSLDDNSVALYKNRIHIFQKKVIRRINSLILSIFKNDQTDYSYEFFSSNISQIAEIKEADVIHLHWVSSGMISEKDLEQIIGLNKTIVWTLHDMYPMTGGCHYAGKCTKYVEGWCEECPRLKLFSKLANSHLKNMYKILENIDITVVGCSTWISKCARESILFRNKKVITIPNTINFDRYYLDTEIKKDKNIVFGAYLVNLDNRKGYEYFKKIATIIQKIDTEIKFTVFGNTDDVLKLPNVEYLGMIKDDETMRKIYGKATISLSLSREENLSCAIMESLACGVPVVAFDIGGNGDLIFDEDMGALVEPFDINLFVEAIFKYINKKHNHEKIMKKARMKFDQEKISSMYESVYLNKANFGDL